MSLGPHHNPSQEQSQSLPFSLLFLYLYPKKLHPALHTSAALLHPSTPNSLCCFFPLSTAKTAEALAREEADISDGSGKTGV